MKLKKHKVDKALQASKVRSTCRITFKTLVSDVGSVAQRKSVLFGISSLAVIFELLLLTDAHLINDISTFHCIAQEICLVYATNFMACVQDQCASLQRELSQRNASHRQHVDELNIQLRSCHCCK